MARWARRIEIATALITSYVIESLLRLGLMSTSAEPALPVNDEAVTVVTHPSLSQLSTTYQGSRGSHGCGGAGRRRSSGAAGENPGELDDELVPCRGALCAN